MPAMTALIPQAKYFCKSTIKNLGISYGHCSGVFIVASEQILVHRAELSFIYVVQKRSFVTFCLF